MEHLVTIPLSEYNELIKIRDEIKPAKELNDLKNKVDNSPLIKAILNKKK